MKSIVLYMSKTGTTESGANKIALSLNIEAKDLNNVKKIDEYDQIILGTYIRMGMIPGKVKKFLKSNESLLLKKKLFVFIVGMGNPNEMIELFKKNISSSLINHITLISHLGGELRIENAGFLEKKIMMKMRETLKEEPHINENEINKFIKTINSK